MLHPAPLNPAQDGSAATTTPTPPPPFQLGGVPIHPIRLDAMLAWFDALIAARQRAVVMYANAFAINLAHQEPAFRDALNEADLVFCDGHGVRIGAALLGHPMPERFTPPDWVDRLAEQCAARGRRLFLLGARPGVAAESARRLQHRHPTLVVAWHHGYFEPDGADNQRLLATIEQARPDVMLVGMGMPRQELWMLANHLQHEVPVTIAVGALFDYLGGQMTRGPRWLTDHGLEWLCRLYFEPRRLWRRYLLGNPQFLLRVIEQRWRERRR